MPRVDRLLSVYCFNPFRKLGLAKNGSISILMYHSISDEPESGHPYFWLNTSPERFAEQMQFLKDNDYTVLSLTDAVNLLQTASKMPTDRYVVLTFDDGFHDFLEHGWPILARFGFPATIFLPTDFIGADRQSFNGRACLTWSEVRELNGRGVSFGSHSVSHSKLHGLPWEAIRRELLDSRMRLEDELQTPALSFAFPYAFPQEDQIFVRHFRQELIDQGYLTAVTTIIGRAQQGSDPLCLKRLPVNGDDDQPLLSAKLSGAYDWLAGAQAILRRTKQYSKNRRISGRGSQA